MKIAFLTANSPEFVGGVEVFMKRLKSILEKRGHKVKIFSLANIELSGHQKLFLSILRFFPYREIYKAKILGNYFNKKNQNFDLVIANDYFGIFANAPKKIMLLHGYYGDVFDSIKHKISPLYYQWGMQLARLQRKAMEKNDITVSFSKHTQQYMQEKGLKVPVIISHGIDTNFFKPIKNPRKRISIDLPTNFLLYVGSQAPWKNIETVKKVAEKEKVVFLNKKDPGSDSLFWIKYVKKSEMPFLYASAEMLLHPALQEGFGYVIAEAMACGTPPIVARTGFGVEISEEMPELVLNNPEDLNEINEKILYIRKNRESLSNKCRKFIEKNNNLKDWEKKWISLIE